MTAAARVLRRPDAPSCYCCLCLPCSLYGRGFAVMDRIPYRCLVLQSHCRPGVSVAEPVCHLIVPMPCQLPRLSLVKLE